MAKQTSLNFKVGETDYTVEVKATKVLVTSSLGTAEHKIKELEREGSAWLEYAYKLPIDGAEVKLFITAFGKKSITVDGVDILTSMPRNVAKMNALAWVFTVLYVVDFVCFMGGALGAIINLMLVYASAAMATDESKTMTKRVISLVIIFVLATVVELFVGVGIASL